MSKKHLFIFIIILCLGAFLRLYKLDNQSFIADEYLGINASYGYHQTGDWVFWDFNNDKPTDEPYTRAAIYYRQVAEIFDFLPATEFNARLVSVLWGVLGIVVIYLVSYLMLRNATISLLAAFLLAVSISALTFDRKLRMYSMLAPMYFLFSYFVYMALEARPQKGLKICKRIYAKIGINLHFAVLALLAGYVSLRTHLLTVNILPTIFFYLLITGALAYKRNKKYLNKYNILLLIGLAAVPFLLQSSYVRDALQFFSYNIWNWSYLQKVSLSYSYILLAAVFFVFGLYYLTKKKGKAGLWLSLSFVVPLVMAIYVWARSAGDQYIYFTEYFRNVIMAAGIYFTAKKVSEKMFAEKNKVAFPALMALALALLVNLPFFFSGNGFYQNPRGWDYPNYRQIFEYYLKHKDNNNTLITRDYMNFYFWKSNARVVNYGPENKLDVEKIKKAQEMGGEAWIIFSNDLYVDGKAKEYIKENFKQVDTHYTNNNVMIWYWEKTETNQ